MCAGGILGKKSAESWGRGVFIGGFQEEARKELHHRVDDEPFAESHQQDGQHDVEDGDEAEAQRDAPYGGCQQPGQRERKVKQGHHAQDDNQQNQDEHGEQDREFLGDFHFGVFLLQVQVFLEFHEQLPEAVDALVACKHDGSVFPLQVIRLHRL